MTACPSESSTLYLNDIGENKCVSHDGHIQLGIFNHSADKHIEMNPTIRWVKTYWMPDVFSKRYLRAKFQSHMKKNEGKPPTDNRADSRPRDFPDTPKCDTIQEKNRLERSL